MEINNNTLELFLNSLFTTTCPNAVIKRGERKKRSFLCHRNSLFTFGRGVGTQVFAWQRSALSHSHSLRRGLSCSCPMALSMCHAFLFRLYDRSMFFGTFFHLLFLFSSSLFMINISFLSIVAPSECPLTRDGRRVLFNQPLFGTKDWPVIIAALILRGSWVGL